MTDLRWKADSNMLIPTITTNRLALRPFASDDVDPLYRIMSNPKVMSYFPPAPLPPPERIERIIQGQLKHWEKHGYGWWAVQQLTSAELIGWAGLQYLPDTDENEVAYLLGQPFWGQGFATEAAGASLDFAFNSLGLSSIVGIVHHENLASQRVLEKLGMTFTERKDYFGMDCFRYLIERTRI
jgi:[ribosomal protein S5]-alanine N-acetyltransferase